VGLGTFKLVAPAEKLVATTGTEIEPVAHVPIIEAMFCVLLDLVFTLFFINLQAEEIKDVLLWR